MTPTQRRAVENLLENFRQHREVEPMMWDAVRRAYHGCDLQLAYMKREIFRQMETLKGQSQ